MPGCRNPLSHATFPKEDGRARGDAEWEAQTWALVESGDVIPCSQAVAINRARGIETMHPQDWNMAFTAVFFLAVVCVVLLAQMFGSWE